MISEKMLLGSEHAHDFSRDVECYNAHTLIPLLNSRDEILSLGFRNPFCFSRRTLSLIVRNYGYLFNLIKQI